MKIPIILVLWCVLLARSVQCINFRVDPRVDPLVLIDQGLVRGVRSSNGQYSSFLGIPYAQIDYENPFGASLPRPSFGDSVFDAYDGSIACPQSGENGLLDCLRLNIYVPSKASSRNLMPVFVWIHGGGFTEGKAGLYAGPNIVDQDIVLVSINYRLGPYGFLCLDTPTVPGNQGLKDQLAALRWIKDNISAFGGNPYDVTIAGQSAGGASVEYHMYSSHEKLFQKAILHSGVALTGTSFGSSDVNSAIKIAGYLGFNTTDTEQALKFLATTPPNLVIAASNELGLLLGSCKEKSFSGVENFIVSNPLSLSNPKKIANTPIMIGITSNEMYGSNENTDVQANALKDILQDYFNLPEEELEQAEALVRHFYIGDQMVSNAVKSELELFSADVTFVHSTERAVSKFLNENSGEIYGYMFNYVHESDDGAINNAPHGAELKYLFASEYDTFNDEQKYITDVLTSLWSNFIKSGNPTPTSSDLVPVIWEAVGSDSRPYLAIESSGVHLEHRFRRQKTAFWNLFYKVYERYHQQTRSCKCSAL